LQMVSYRVEFTRSAEKDLRRIDKSRVPTIYDEIERLAADPRPHGVKKLAGADRTYRIRVGDYRVVYEIEDYELLVLVIRVAHRKDVYT
jgi:mRNA interferase RelE/StbE